MYRRQRSFPGWLVALAAALLVFGSCYLWQGAVRFFESAGNILAPATETAAATSTIATREVPTIDVPPMNFVFTTPVTPRPCYEFYVTVVRARVRECPRETCETMEMPYEGNILCVHGPSNENVDWYEVNLAPNDTIARIGYMHKSVIAPVKPTPRPTRTPIPSDTPIPSRTPLPTPTIPLATVTPLPTQTPSPTPTPQPSITPTSRRMQGA